jgi:hypothetical protein
MNKEHFADILNTIEANPSCWDQARWHCGSSHCFAGWAQLKSGKPAVVSFVRRDAREWLDISKVDADWLFAVDRTIDDFKWFLTSEGFDCEGYDCNGYDRNGYARNGYDRYGYDRNGYALDGYDRNGYDRNGYDFDGLDKNNKSRSDQA